MSFQSSPLAGTSPRCPITKSVSGLFFSPVLNVVNFKVNIVLLSLALGSQWANGSSLLAMRKKVWERNSGGECVCSCSLMCLVQNWFKASGHRKRATLHSRHVPKTSSRGSTIAIEQPRLQTPKWVCSVLQCPTWQSATYSTSLAPNMPSPSCCYFSIFSSSSSLSASFSLTSPLSVLVYFCPPICMSVLFAHVFYLSLSPFPCIHRPSCPATMFWLLCVFIFPFKSKPEILTLCDQKPLRPADV